VAEFFTSTPSPEGQSPSHKRTGYLPITRAAYELTKKQGFYNENPGPEVAILQLLNKPPTPNSMGIRFGFMPQIREIIDEEWEAILADKKTPQQGLDDMVRRGNEKLREFERINK